MTDRNFPFDLYVFIVNRHDHWGWVIPCVLFGLLRSTTLQGVWHCLHVTYEEPEV